MKQFIKRVLLLTGMAAILFVLSACGSNSADTAEMLDPQMAFSISQVTENLLEQIAGMNKEDAEYTETTLLRQKEDGLASGITSWLSVMDDTGPLIGIYSSDTELSDDDEYMSTVQAKFANRDGEFKVFYTMDASSGALDPTSITFSPVYTTGEKMAKAAMNTLLGMGTVFCVLIFISFLISRFKYISVIEAKMKEKKAAKTAAAAPAAAPAPAPAVEEETETELADDLELVAVITAAIAAASETPADGLIVRSIRRAPASRWKRA